MRKINVHTLVDETAQNVEINECVDSALKFLDTWKSANANERMSEK